MSDQAIGVIIGMFEPTGTACTQNENRRKNSKNQDVIQFKISNKKNLKFMKKYSPYLVSAIIICLQNGLLTRDVFAQNGNAFTAPFELSRFYYPSGWMGDGISTNGEESRYIILNDQYTENPHSKPICIRITYLPGPKKWAGIYWQTPANNWGERPGRTINGASKITFWARGESGGELVEFKAGGIYNVESPYKDSFEVSIGVIKLTSKWEKYEIDLSKSDLSSVIGAFACSVAKSGNPNGLTFYLDDIQCE